MADAAARREARKRRILENAEYRLQRITGQANNVENSDERCKRAIANDVQPKTSCSTANGILSSEALIGHQSVDSLINELNADINIDDTDSPYSAEHDIFTLLSSPNAPHRRSTRRANVSSENGNATPLKLNNSNDIGFSLDRQDVSPGAQMGNTDRDNQNGNTSQESSALMALLSSRLVYVILAVIINIMVLLKMEHLFGMSIVVPFIVIMIGRLCLCKSYEDSRGGNMLVAALILSNVRPDFVKIIHRLKGSFTLFGKVFQDFAVYIFAFVIIYTIIYRYWNDLDDIVMPYANEPEAMINDNASM